ncbi:hypothetical protein [Pontiella sp.]|uniref:hypothetical protein n=1 Tax=Pontiella sp. TaxID=2837462 RepID=UPI00356B0858
MKLRLLFLMSLLAGASVFAQETDVLELTAGKDLFGRSNRRNANSGASSSLVLAPNLSVVSLVAFDLSGVTNEIQSAEFSFRIQETHAVPLSLTVAPMVHNEQNASWAEGAGDLGVLGRNARIGEATFQWRAFRDRQWLDAKERPVTNLADAGLWKPALATRSAIPWISGEWVTVSINDAAFLEEIRNHEVPQVTFGLWGTSGDGIYRVNAKESGLPAKLNLTVKLPPKPAQPE